MNVSITLKGFRPQPSFLIANRPAIIIKCIWPSNFKLTIHRWRNQIKKKETFESFAEIATVLSVLCYASFIKISFYDHITNDTNSWLRVFWTLSMRGERYTHADIVVLPLHRSKFLSLSVSLHQIVVVSPNDLNKWIKLFRWKYREEKIYNKNIGYRILKLFYEFE